MLSYRPLGPALRMNPAQKLLLVLLLTFCGFAPAYAADWSYVQHDPEHTGQSEAILDASKLMLSWTAPQGYTAPHIVGDTIYSTKSQGGFSGTKDNGTKWATYISAFDLHTGAIKWTRSGNNIFPSAAAVGGGLVVFYGGMTTCASCADPAPDAQQLVVLDAATGALRYKVPIPGEMNEPGGELCSMPLLIQNPTDGTVMAYLAGYRTIWAVWLGPTGGSLLWKWRSTSTDFGGSSIPTLAGDAVLVGGIYQLFAFNRHTGVPIPVNENHGGGAQTAVYDVARRHIYVSGYGGLKAYRYANDTQIEFLWQREAGGSSTGNVDNGSLALGPDGKVYIGSAGNAYVENSSLLLELDPNTGATLRSAPVSPSNSRAPSITKGFVWMPGWGKTHVFDLATMQLVRILPGSNENGHPGAGAFADNYAVIPHGTNVFSNGFDVWARPTARPLNISTRLRAQSNGGHEMFAGFTISGSEPKQVLIRALGPTLQQFGISDTLPDPSIELHDWQRVIGTNNNWKDSQASEIQASGLAPSYDSEAAMIITLNPGAYTAIVRDVNGGAGVAVVEVYDQGRDAPVKLSNISTRGYVETGDNMMIGGFILGNEDIPALVVIRALGPSLAKFGSTEFLPDPVMELHDANGALLRSNDNWRDTQEAEITATGLAPENNAESAIIATLPPSAYTAIVAGRNGQTGVGVVEVYHVR